MATREARSQRSLGRLTEIAQVAVRHGFGYFLRRHRLSDLVPWGERDPIEATASDRGRRLREMLDELGPTFVKFGQLLSTRPDVVPPDIVVELRGLQDDVKPVPFGQVRGVLEAELALRVEQAFLEFDELPIASASIGQVHRAVLPDGREVAVKVQRPAAPSQIEADLGLLYQAARLLKERVRALEFIDPQELVDEFARSIRLELDYGHEARNAETFHRNFVRNEDVVVPRVIRQYSTGRVLTLEFLRGKKVSELDVETMRPDERRAIAYRMADTWMTMVFRHGCSGSSTSDRRGS
ncbi:MAG: AarF/ABC1/UbiB kinase family protein [Actinobacteria bacterium]|nr:MAG: AarF/ABC1/UbiB kinase family protein [Actinomycetota bacterium]